MEGQASGETTEKAAKGPAGGWSRGDQLPKKILKNDNTKHQKTLALYKSCLKTVNT